LKRVDAELSEDKSNALQEKIDASNKQLDKLKQEQMLSSSAQLIYKKFIATAKEHNNCPLCSRSMPPVEHKDFLENLQAKVDRVSSDAGRQAAKDNIAKTRQRVDLVSTQYF
jgi:DNA repair exonuclease SbcCD ATPase subunit